MRPVRSLLLYFAIVFFAGALLSPWLYFLTRTLAAGHTGFEQVVQAPFHRYVNRTLLLAALVGLWPLLPSLGVRNWRDAGLPDPRKHWREMASGLLIGFCSLALVAGIVLACGARTLNFDHPASNIAETLARTALIALLVAFLEELLFRGAIFGGLLRVHRIVPALALSSAIYAIVHFFSKPPSPEAIDWASGFASLPRMMRGFGDWELLLPGFFNLLLAGIVLALGCWMTGTLYFSIGLHAGWIFWLKFYGYLTRGRPEGMAWLWGTGKLIDGWLVTLVLAGLLFALIYVRRPLENRCSVEG